MLKLKLKLPKKLLSLKTSSIMLIVVLAMIGVIWLISSKAATFSISIETETNAPSNLVISDSSASGSKAIIFKAQSTSTVNATTPCVGASAPTQWKHVVVLIFENKKFSEVIGSQSAPYITSLANKCGTYASWKDANYKANGQLDRSGDYPSKPNYATYASGVSPSVHKITTDDYKTTTSVDNIFNKLKNINKSAKVYQSGGPGSCAVSNFSGAYHDPMRYFTNLGAQSSDPKTYCNQNDPSINDFMTDVNNDRLPAFAMVLPTNSQNMHDNSISSGDTWASAFLTPLLNSNRYKSGDTAVFFLWDEDTPIPLALIAPSIKAGSKPTAPASGSPPISHFSATRTWQEMLGVQPLLGDSGQAPSLLGYFNGK